MADGIAWARQRIWAPGCYSMASDGLGVMKEERGVTVEVGGAKWRMKTTEEAGGMGVNGRWA